MTDDRLPTTPEAHARDISRRRSAPPEPARKVKLSEARWTRWLPRSRAGAARPAVVLTDDDGEEL